MNLEQREYTQSEIDDFESNGARTNQSQRNIIDSFTTHEEEHSREQSRQI